MEFAGEIAVGSERKASLSRCWCPAWVVPTLVGVVACLAFLNLLGWWMGLPSLRLATSGEAPLHPSAAVAFLVACTGMLGALKVGRRPWTTLLGGAAGATITALGLAGLFAFWTDVPLDLRAFGIMPPQENSLLALNTSACFVFLGVGICTLFAAQPMFRLREVAVIALGMISWLTLLGYAFSLPSVYRAGGVSMSLLGSLLFLVLAGSLLYIRPKEGITGVLLSRQLGGVVARRMMPLAFLIPLLIGYVRLFGERSGLYSPNVSMALAMVLVTVTLLVQAAVLSTRIEAVDRERDGAFRALSRAESELRSANLVLADLAALDPLTGLLNRRSFDHMLAREIEKSKESRRPLSLMMIDVDHFKSYNDRHGHKWGDELLKGVAQVLRENSRVGDGVARYGGDEFALILPNATRAQAEHIAERIRRLVAIGDWRNSKVTLCAGVASLEDEGHESIVEAADACLYEAKHRGRNLVVGCTDRLAP